MNRTQRRRYSRHLRLMSLWGMEADNPVKPRSRSYQRRREMGKASRLFNLLHARGVA